MLCVIFTNWGMNSELCGGGWEGGEGSTWSAGQGLIGVGVNVYIPAVEVEDCLPPCPLITGVQV